VFSKDEVEASFRRSTVTREMTAGSVGRLCGRWWIAAGALEQADVEDELYAAAECNGLVADDGDRQCWATIRSGLGAGLQ
jgi:hypothetical protein